MAGDADGEFQGAVCAAGGAGEDTAPLDETSACGHATRCDRSGAITFRQDSASPAIPAQDSFGRTKRQDAPCGISHDAHEKMLRMRSHFHENTSLVLRPERHKTLEILQHRRASSEANPIRPPMVPIKAGCEIATRWLGHFPERCFQNRGAPEIRLGF